VPTTNIDGLEIHYDHFAAKDSTNSRRLLYIHGTGCNGRVFERHHRALSQHHEIVAIDLPGHGKSSGGGFRSVVEHAFYVAALIEDLNWDSCIVAGHSMGGGIALALAVYFDSLVSGLLLIDTGARLRVNPKVIDQARKIAAGDRSIQVNSRFGYADGTSQSVVDEINRINAGCDPQVIYKDWIADDSCDFLSRLGGIDAPALAICGKQDPLTPPKYHEFLRDKMPNCKMVTIEKSGHWPFAESPQAFDAAIIQFVAEL
jgi:pimeloyl-ACP methyl ester carboxylesterase